MLKFNLFENFKNKSMKTESKKLSSTIYLFFFVGLFTSLTFGQKQDTINSVIDSTYISVDSLNINASLYPFTITDRSSPKAVLMNFIDYMNKSYILLKDANERNLKISGFFVAKELKNQVSEAELLFERALYCLDLSGFPPSIQKDMGYGRAIMLKEILDRINLPPFKEIPDYTAIEMDLESKKHPKYDFWRIPDTEIVLMKTQEGVHKGEYFFSPETIEKLPFLYKQIIHVPYKSRTDVSKGFYSFYVTSPGVLMPPRWSIYLPKWSIKEYYSQTVWQWLALLGSLIIALIIIKVFYSILIQGNYKFSILLKQWKKAMFFTLLIVITVFLSYLINKQINITGQTLIVSKIILESFTWILIALLVYNVLLAMAEVIINAPKVAKMGIEATYTRATFMVTALLTSFFIIIFGLSQVGVSIVPLITGVGIGGIAIALAARSTLENIIGSFTIFADKPYRVNDRVKILNYNGTIESIGIRSTQIRLLTGPLVSIPNEKMATVEIENIQARRYIRRNFDLRIKYESPLEEVEKSLKIIRGILDVPENEENHPNTAINKPYYTPRVFFDNINTDSYNISITYWHFPPNHWEFMKLSEDINFQIIRNLNEASIEFAFPTQMLHLSGENNSKP